MMEDDPRYNPLIHGNRQYGPRYDPEADLERLASAARRFPTSPVAREQLETGQETVRRNAPPPMPKNTRGGVTE